MPSSAIASSVETTALVPYLPARRASPDDIRSRSVSTFMTAAETSSTAPISRFPQIHPRSEGTIAPLSSPIRNESSENPTPTTPSAASSEGNPGIPTISCCLAPANRLDAGLGEHQERADDHGEIGEIGRIHETLPHRVEVLSRGHPLQHRAEPTRAAD